MQSTTAASSDLVDELVHQFTDPYACYRELIQNSIDAGSSRIDVTVAYRPTPGGNGLMTASVQDWGEGMNRRLIEDYLITKFRSSKENDLTKIGKYGIGFVSVFALQPDAVTVDTGRDGESWRVLFKKDRTYELLKPTEMFEGTRVTLHRKSTLAEYEEHVARARDALARWCRHSEVDVTFAAGGADGSPPGAAVSVHEPVKVDAPYQVEHREEGLVIAVGPSRTDPAPSGFYNRGLTLLETVEPLLPGIALKIVSRTLEHTLTRDNVRRDQGFERTMELARKLADGPLAAALPDELKKAAERPDGSADWRTLMRFAKRLGLSKSKLSLRAPGGGAQAPKGIGKNLVYAGAPTPTVQRLRAAGTVVVECPDADPYILDLQQQLGTDALSHSADRWFTFAEPPTTAQPEGFAAALTELLNEVRCPVEGIVLAELRGAAATAQWAFIEALGRPTYIVDAGRVLARKQKRPLVCLNLGHEQVKKARGLLERAPRLAALLFARAMLLRAKLLDEATDAALTAWALQ